MRILIDECLDWRICRSLVGHTCTSVQKMGWAGVRNGELLRLAQSEFDVFVTGDRNLSFQQEVSNLGIAVIVLRAKSIQLHDMLPLMPRLLETLPALAPGEIMNLS